jgi:hypothetical protein
VTNVRAAALSRCSPGVVAVGSAVVGVDVVAVVTVVAVGAVVVPGPVRPPQPARPTAPSRPTARSSRRREGVDPVTVVSDAVAGGRFRRVSNGVRTSYSRFADGREKRSL